MQLNGAEIVIECLKEQGVDTVFGYPGGAILNVYDELYKHRDEIRHILTSHEQGASHAADGYARATGKVGVCLATSGPGATNLVTGIATAYMDSIPIVAITCNVGVSLLGKDSFQEIDIAGITMPITKYSFIVKDVTKLADTIRKAFRIAKTGRPGPVLVDIPKDITAKVTEYIPEELGKCTKEDSSRKTPRMDEQRFDRVISMLEEAEKPFVFVGGGAVLSGASQELKEFVDKLDAPVTDSLMIPLPYWSRLQNGETIETEDKVYTPDLVLGPPRKGIKLTYTTDTRPTDSIKENAAGSDLFICEGMYGEQEKAAKAVEYKHMTFYEAAALAKEAEVEEMWLTHYSPSLTKPQYYMDEVRRIFPRAKAGNDGMTAELMFED